MIEEHGTGGDVDSDGDGRVDINDLDVNHNDMAYEHMLKGVIKGTVESIIDRIQE